MGISKPKLYKPDNLRTHHSKAQIRKLKNLMTVLSSSKSATADDFRELIQELTPLLTLLNQFIDKIERPEPLMRGDRVPVSTLNKISDEKCRQSHAALEILQTR